MPNTQNVDPFPSARLQQVHASQFMGISTEVSKLPGGEQWVTWLLVLLHPTSLISDPQKAQTVSMSFNCVPEQNLRIVKGIHKCSALGHPGTHLPFQHMGKLKQEASLDYRTSLCLKQTRAKTEKKANKERQVGRFRGCSAGDGLATRMGTCWV